MAMKFYSALRGGDQATVTSIIKTFFIPFCRLRDRKKGYAVSLIKAGADIVGHPAGNVRAPLTMPTAAEKEELAAIINACR
jgi:5-dehydro-4-deoxyglucarate dehydratase